MPENNLEKSVNCCPPFTFQTLSKYLLDLGWDQLHVLVRKSTMDRASNILKVISLTKKALHLGLFIGFVLLSSFALKDLTSHDKTIQVNKINQNYVSNFPSFTVCFALMENT